MEKEREWVIIKGRKLLWKEFIFILDDYRGRRVIRERGDRVSDRYNHMICALQEMADCYHRGQDSITDLSQELMGRCYMEMPVERKLPEALEELFDQLQSNLNLDLTELLDECLDRTERAWKRIQEERRKETERIAVVRSLLESNGSVESENQSVEERICNLIRLQKAKLESSDYVMHKGENRTANIWCELLASSLFCDVITYGQMQRLLENGLMWESEISKLLKDRYGIKKDYEWYSEDFLGCGLEEETDIRIEDILPLCQVRAKEILGIGE